MGDRCYVTITARKQDQAAIEEIMGGAQTEDAEIVNGNDIVTLGFEDVNYGGVTDREEIANKGIPFYGNHTAGDEYDAYLFAARNKALVDVPADNEGTPFVLYDDKARPYKGMVGELKLYYTILKKAKMEMGIIEPTKKRKKK